MSVSGSANVGGGSWLDRAEETVSHAADSVENAAEDVGHGIANTATNAYHQAEQGAVNLEHRLQAAVLPENFGHEDRTSNASHSHDYGNPADAQSAFQRQSAALLDVNHWNQMSGMENANFKLFDANGNPSNHNPPQVGDFVRIDLPGPNPHDWVRIEDLHTDPNDTSVRVRPSYDPTQHPPNTSVTAHFFTNQATNEFSVRRDGSSVTAGVHGEHESANVGSQASGPLMATRNGATTYGAWGMDIPGTNRTTSMQQHQWNTFTENLNNK